jgi:regulator of sirC expression with transglutaminase-like and TPR domain
VILYGLDGREEEQRYWLGRVERYREANPYYHASLGEQAGEEGEWNVALRHYDQALELNPDDSHILFARGLVHQQLGQFGLASDDIKRAIERATLNSDIRSYQQALEEVHKERLAGV